MLEYIYQAIGLLLLAFAVQTFLDKANNKRWGSGLFWLVYALSFSLGKFIPDWLVGVMVVILSLLAAAGFLGRGSYKEITDDFAKQQALLLKNKLFLPALVIPLFTVLWSLLTDSSALIGLGISSFLAFAAALLLTRSSARQGIHEGRRLMDVIGWAAILSQFLAAFGYLLAEAGVGATIAQLVQNFIPRDNLPAYVLAYTFGMALFTIIMGNAFAAFAVITTGIGIPLLVIAEHGNPLVVGVLGMLAGYCGTLMTPMAANFNIVPAALLELQDKNYIIRLQILPGFVMLLLNSALLYFTAF